MRNLNFIITLLASATILLAGCKKTTEEDSPEYTITVTSDKNGSAEADAEKAVEGAEISITATPKSGYKLDKWVVISGGVALSDKTDNPATFTMPAKNVSIKAKFIEKSAQVYDVDVTGDENGTAKATVDGDEVTEAAEGDIIQITATADNGYYFVKWRVVNGGISFSDETANPATFTMPAKAVAIKAEFISSDAWDGTTKSAPQDLDHVNKTATIASPAELAWLSSAVNGNEDVTDPAFEGYIFELTKNLNLNNHPWMPIGKTYDMPFKGTFQGNNKKIYGLNIVFEGRSGLFGLNMGTISNLHIASGSISGDTEAEYIYSIGGICGTNERSGSITGCSNAATIIIDIKFHPVGGICGNNGGNIENCSNTGTISGYYAGGICGEASAYATILKCHNEGEVSATSETQDSGCAGGIIGYNKAMVKDCWNTGKISGENGTGGICGENSGSIIACYNTGTILGESYTGGVCGLNGNSGETITACYNTGAVTGGRHYTGGICGYNYVKITACYNTGTVASTDPSTNSLGSFCGNNSTDEAAVITACYGAGNDTLENVGAGQAGDIQKFSDTAWPVTGTASGQSAEWGVGDGSDSGKYWKSIGSWNNGTPTYPTLWFE